MSRVTDEDLRATFRVRAAGRPHPGLRQRIRSSTLRSQAPRVDPVSNEVADRRPILVRLTAVAAVAAGLLLAPLLGAESEIPLGFGPASGSPAGPAVGVTFTSEDDDGDDEGDGEDGVDEGDDGADEDDGDDEGDGEDGVDEQDDGGDEDEGEADD